MAVNLEAATNPNYRKTSAGLTSSTLCNRSVDAGSILSSEMPIHKTGSKPRDADFLKEMRLLSKLRHPSIMTVMGDVVNKKHEPMLVMEYMEHGLLYEVIHNGTVDFEGELLLSILKDVSRGVQFLHNTKPQVLHKDLKSANILVDSHSRAKVADFELLKRLTRASGMAFWMAPELLRGGSLNTAASDVYAFGVVLYEIYSRKDPYEGEDF